MGAVLKKGDGMKSEKSIQLERKISGCFKEISSLDWFSTDIHNTYFELKTIVEELAPSRDDYILDVGCARGRFLKPLSGFCDHLFGIDITDVFVIDARKNVPLAGFAVSSGSFLPFHNASFDCLFCVEVLEHIPDTAEAVHEMARLIKKGGKMMIIDKNMLGLDVNTALPNFIMKPYKEFKNKWMYSRDFPFREKWFYSWTIRRLMKPYFQSVKVIFLQDFENRRTHRYARHIPLFSKDIAWIGLDRK